VYCTQALRCFSAETLTFFLPQLVQSLRDDHFGYLATSLVSSARRSNLFAHQLMWVLSTESEKPEDDGEVLFYPGAHGFQGALSGSDSLPVRCRCLMDQVKSGFSPAMQRFFDDEYNFFVQVTEISGKLRDVRAAGGDLARSIKEHAVELNVDRLLYLPTNPTRRVVSVDTNSGAPMQSAKKCPFLLTFGVTPFDGPDSVLGNDAEEESSVEIKHTASPVVAISDAVDGASSADAAPAALSETSQIAVGSHLCCHFVMLNCLQVTCSLILLNG
jgi:phosphatidylinositol 4-kinase